MKEAVVAAEELAPFDEEADETVLVTDASAHAVAGFLLQRGRLVALHSRPLTEVQARWPAFDLEAFALTHCLQRWRHWCFARRVRCVSDHGDLSVLLHPPSGAKDKLLRYVAVLADFDISLEYMPGTSPTLALADWLSRPNTGARLPLRAVCVGDSRAAEVAGGAADSPSARVLS